MAPALAALVAAFIAGHPTQIACDTDTNPGPVPPLPGFIVEAWTTYGGSTIHMHPSLCADLRERPGSPAFAHGLGVLIHESAHAKGVRSESCAETYANVAVREVLRRFYRLPYKSSTSTLVGQQMYQLTLRRPPEYQLRPDACVGEPH